MLTYVFFACPSLKHICPTRAADWSPKHCKDKEVHMNHCVTINLNQFLLGLKSQLIWVKCIQCKWKGSEHRYSIRVYSFLLPSTETANKKWQLVPLAMVAINLLSVMKCNIRMSLTLLVKFSAHFNICVCRYGSYIGSFHFLISYPFMMFAYCERSKISLGLFVRLKLLTHLFSWLGLNSVIYNGLRY